MIATALLASLAAPQASASERLRAIERRYDRECVARAPRSYEGIWLDGMESQTFRPGLQASRRDVVRSPVWLELAPAERRLWKLPGEPTEKRFYIRFVGREHVPASANSLCGYGHFGMFGQEITVDRVISMRAIAG